jgi:Sortase domain
MRVARQLCYLVALVLVLALDGCNFSATMPSAAVSASTVHEATTPITVISTIPPKRPRNAKATPSHLLIPAIGINAAVEEVGILTHDDNVGGKAGDLATPTGSPWEHVGWYAAGPRPGEQGSAVIDGHLDDNYGQPAVFWNLRKLHVGDEVQVVMSNGKKLTFRVSRIASYPPLAAPLQDIFGNNGGIYLNLITCAGKWIPSEHQTTLRLVVYTTLLA